jgi:hypothetical protein
MQRDKTVRIRLDSGSQTTATFVAKVYSGTKKYRVVDVEGALKEKLGQRVATEDLVLFKQSPRGMQCELTTSMQIKPGDIIIMLQPGEKGGLVEIHRGKLESPFVRIKE